MISKLAIKQDKDLEIYSDFPTSGNNAGVRIDGAGNSNASSLLGNCAC